MRKILTVLFVCCLATTNGLHAQQNTIFKGDSPYLIPNEGSDPLILDDNQWNYIAITIDGSRNGRVYKNGQLAFEGKMASNSYIWSRLELGAVYYTSYSQWFNGWIDEVRVSNVVRPSASFAEHYASGLPPESDDHTIGLWHFDQESGSQVIAEKGPGGTIYGATWDPAGRFGQCLYFNGVDQRATIPISIPTSNMTFEFWIKPKTQHNSWPVSWYGMYTAGFITQVEIIQDEQQPAGPDYSQIGIEGKDTVCACEESIYSVSVNTDRNGYIYRDTISSGFLDMGIPSGSINNTFTYDLWIKPGRTINMSPESNVCVGGVSVPLANSNQNWAIYPTHGGYTMLGTGLTIGTNGLMVGEHSHNVLVPRLSYTTEINGWAHVAIVYRPDSLLLYLNGNLVRARSSYCTSNVKFVSTLLGRALYSPEFKGNLDEVRIWDIALTREQIRHIMNKKILTEVDGLRYYAGFDNGKFERTQGDLGTPEMIVEGLSEDLHIRSGDIGLSPYMGETLDVLKPFDQGSVTVTWSNGTTGSTASYIANVGENLIHATTSGSAINRTDSMIVIGLVCDEKNLSFKNQEVKVGEIIKIPVYISQFNDCDKLLKIQFVFDYNGEQLKYSGISDQDALIDGNGTFQVSQGIDQILFNWETQEPLSGEGVLVNLLFEVLTTGQIMPEFSAAAYNDIPFFTGKGMIVSYPDDDGFIVKDIDENLYTYVTICSQQWLAQNLRVSRYNNGDELLYNQHHNEWRNSTEGIWSWYNDEEGNNPIYGKLYNWYAVNDERGICPAGWKVPTDEDWDILVNCIDPNAWGNNNTLGTRLKSSRQVNSPLGGIFNTTEHPRWDSHGRRFGTDDFGFSALPAGGKTPGNSFIHLGQYAYFWSITETYDKHAWLRVIMFSQRGMSRSQYLKNSGKSVRCVRDVE